MKLRNIVVLTLASGLTPFAAQAAVEIYGSANLSVDVIDDSRETNLGVSNNASRIGFKGEQALQSGHKAFFVLESTIDFSGEAAGLSSRNRYLGLSGNFGEVHVGTEDTPFKVVAGKFDIFGDTAGDRRSILGLTSSGTDQYNQRAKNAIAYTTPNLGGFKGAVMYSTSYDGSPTSTSSTAIVNSTGADENDKSLTSLGGFFENGPLWVGGSYEMQTVKNGDNTSGVRLGGSYTFAGKTRLGLLLESLDGDTNARLSRNAYGVNVAHPIGATTLKGQILMADDSDLAAGNDSANNITLGVSHMLDKQLEVYGLYTMTSNDDNASYMVAAGGHDGDKISLPAAGKDGKALSVGAVYKF